MVIRKTHLGPSEPVECAIHMFTDEVLGPLTAGRRYDFVITSGQHSFTVCGVGWHVYGVQGCLYGMYMYVLYV